VQKIQVTKFDAIRAQLDAAIELYFLSENTIATHTLAAAAYNALRDIAKRDGAEHPFLKTEYLESLSETERQRTIRFLNEPENFFKHADRDPHASIPFDPNLTELLLMDALAYFRTSSEPKPKYYDIFKVWVGEIRKEVLEDDALRSMVETVRDAIKAKGKIEFWNCMIEYLYSRLSMQR
jgi:hypothetical protein